MIGLFFVRNSGRTVKHLSHFNRQRVLDFLRTLVNKYDWNKCYILSDGKKKLQYYLGRGIVLRRVALFAFSKSQFLVGV